VKKPATPPHRRGSPARAAAVEINAPDLVDPADYQAALSHLFPSPGAFQYFCKKHKAKLRKAGALVLLNRRTKVNPPRMSPMILEIAQQEGEKAEAQAA
jgi:hypothetical protein